MRINIKTLLSSVAGAALVLSSVASATARTCKTSQFTIGVEADNTGWLKIHEASEGRVPFKYERTHVDIDDEQRTDAALEAEELVEEIQDATGSASPEELEQMHALLFIWRTTAQSASLDTFLSVDLEDGIAGIHDYFDQDGASIQAFGFHSWFGAYPCE